MIQNTSINSLNNISKPNLDNKIEKKLNKTDKISENTIKEFIPKEQAKNDLALEEDLEILESSKVSTERLEKVEILMNTNIEKNNDNSKEDILLNNDLEKIDLFLSKTGKKEPREQLFNLSKIKTENVKGKEYLENQIKNLRDTYLKKFDNGINKSNTTIPV